MGSELPAGDEIQSAIKLFQDGRYAHLEPIAIGLTVRYPDYGPGWNLLAAVLKKLRRVEEALAPMRRAVDLMPGRAELLSNLGTTYQALGRLAEAEESYRKAIAVQGDHFDALFNLGLVLARQDRHAEAESMYRSAIALAPDVAETRAETHYRLGLSLADQGRCAEAETSFSEALSINPRHAKASDSLSYALLEQGRVEEAIDSCRRALEIEPESPELLGNLLFTLNYLPAKASRGPLGFARRFGQLVAARSGAPYSSWLCDAKPERLRVGLVSGDFKNHPVSHFLQSLLANVEPAFMEFFAYSTSTYEDAVTARIKPSFAKWTRLSGIGDVDAARLVHADKVQVLLDLSGHTGYGRLGIFTLRPAPLQASWLGYLATTGLAEIDYVISDSYCSVEGDESNFSEQPWRLPETCICLSTPGEPVSIGPPPALLSGFVTFGSFNTLAKLNDAVIAVWARVLRAVPDSRLYLKNRRLNDPLIRESVAARFGTAGVGADRLILGGTQSAAADHLAEYNRIDMALDTFPHPGVTTSIEALWMGVPVLTLKGDGTLLRAGECIARNADLKDWIADSEDEYVAKAIRFASEIRKLTDLRQTLRDQVMSSPLCDGRRFARNFEDALRQMWRRRVPA